MPARWAWEDALSLTEAAVPIKAAGMAASLERRWHAGGGIGAPGREAGSRRSRICVQPALPGRVRWESVPAQACLSIIDRNWAFFLKAKSVIHVEIPMLSLLLKCQYFVMFYFLRAFYLWLTVPV